MHMNKPVFHTLESENPTFLMTTPVEKPALNMHMNFSKVAVYIHVCTSKMKIHDRSVLAKLLAQYAVLFLPYNVEAYRNSNFSHTCRQRTVRPLPCTHFVSTPPTTTPPASATTYTSSTCAGQVCNIRSRISNLVSNTSRSPGLPLYHMYVFRTL